MNIMLKGKDLVVFGTDYGRHPDCTQHVLNVLAESNRVLWVNSVGKRSPRLSRYDLSRIFSKVMDVVARKPIKNHGITTISPPVVPFHRNPCVRALNRRIVPNSVRRKMQSIGFRKPIVVVSVPTAIEFATEIPRSLLVAFYVDNYVEMPFVDRAFMEKTERRLLSSADMTFVPSQHLWRDKRSISRRIMYLPHGVDANHFRRSGRGVPPEMRDIAKPVVGYFGLMHDCLDVDLIRTVAKALPDCSFVLIGNSQESVFGPDEPSNVSLLGYKPYEVLPDYANAFDVGIIPYTLNVYTKYVNPLKLLEYLSCGLPVVATPIHDVVQQGGELAYVAEDAKAFASAIRRAIREDSPARRRQRLEAAEGNSWRARAETFSREVLAILNQKTGRPRSPSSKEERCA